ncbi:DUF2877 domain-containing protein [Brevibacillus sp. SYSU BS000544]|uniref:oxamate carbamoyltransferase subunit AllH family protein n=1 Tax=Brevibacillus sp. SYSU BS000544 TaxID=3416443 RepID=UPI003CE51E4B
MHISRIDSELFRLIKEEKVTSINIQSSFQTSLSGYSGDYFITILNSTKELLPMSMVIGGNVDELNIHNKNSLTISNDEASPLFYDERTAGEDLHVQKAEDSSINRETLHEVRNFLIESAMAESFYPLLTKTRMVELPAGKESSFFGNESFMIEKVKTFLVCLSKGDLCSAPNITGFGPGLTPSSDDFLLGLLSVLLYAGDEKSKTLIQYLTAYKEKTTEVSKWMLHYASIHSLFPNVVKRFFKASGENRKKVLQDFLSHGGTSGIDLLCGIYTGLFLLFKDEGS